MTVKFSRRGALAAAASVPVLGLLPMASAQGAAEPAAGLAPLAHRMMLGDFEVTVLLAGTATGTEPQKIFGMNVSADEFARVSAEGFVPADRFQSFMLPVVVKTPEAVVLFDTGMNPEGVLAALAAAGMSAQDIDVVILTHMHGDHIGGLTGEAGETFPKARYLAGQIEFDHWAAAGNEMFDAKVKPLRDRMELLADGASPLAGFEAILAAGHTPGHMVWRITSGDAVLWITGDTANHYLWSLENPDWEVRYDMDKAAAAATRRKIFGRIAEERAPFIGYHMPFPGVGFVSQTETGFRYHPASYQFKMTKV